MPTVSQGASLQVTIPVGDSYTVTSGGDAYVDLLSGAPGSPYSSPRLRAPTESKTFGPYPEAAVIRVRAVIGSAQVERVLPSAEQRVVDLTAAEIASPSAAVLADTKAVYRLNVSPFTRYTSDGTTLVAAGGGTAPGFNVVPTLNDLTTDNTVDLQAAVTAAEGGIVTLSPTKRYIARDTIVLPKGQLLIEGNNAAIYVQFGTNYSKPLFKIYDVEDRSASFSLQFVRIFGNCLVMQSFFQVDNPDAGQKVFLDRVYFDTQDSARRAGTGLFAGATIDFCTIENCTILNADLGIQIGDPARINRRNNTQVTIRQVGMAYVTAGMLLRGMDKFLLQGVDIARCNSGITFDGNVARGTMDNCHVEGLASTLGSLTTGSAKIAAGAQGIAYYFPDNTESRSILMTHCSLIDLGGTGGAAVAGVRLGTATNLTLQTVKMVQCGIPLACEGSATYKPIINRGKLDWEGPWAFTGSGFGVTSGGVTPTNANDPQLFANGLNYVETLIKDNAGFAPTSPNLLPGNTVLSLYDAAAGTPPTFTEGAADTRRQQGYSVTFQGQIGAGVPYELYKRVLLPYGWITLDVTGYKGSGQIIFYVALNAAPFTQKLYVQFYAPGGDVERRWRLTFFNADHLLAHRVGFTAVSAAAGADTMFISNISIYKGFARDGWPISPVDVVAALPTVAAGTLWLNKSVILRATGAADVVYDCLQNSAGTPVWTRRALALTTTGTTGAATYNNTTGTLNVPVYTA